MVDVRQVQPEHLDDLLAAQHQPGLGAAGVELGQPLAQQGQEHADVEGQGPPGDQPGQLDGLVVGREAAQVGVPSASSTSTWRPEHRHVVADLSAQVEQEGPGLLVGVAVDGPLHRWMTTTDRSDGPEAIRPRSSITRSPSGRG